MSVKQMINDGAVRRSVYIPAAVNEALEKAKRAQNWRSINSLILEAVAEKYMGGNRPKFPEDDE